MIETLLPLVAVVTVISLVVIVVMLRKIVQTAEVTTTRQEHVLARMEAATKVVASDLKDSVSRADATVGPDGAAADAALRTGDTAAAITKRQAKPVNKAPRTPRKAPAKKAVSPEPPSRPSPTE